MATTLQDIANHLQLSKSLVKGVLANRPGIWASAENRRRIVQTASELGYRPNLTARALATGRTQTIGLWIAHLDDPHYANLFRCLQQQLIADNYQLVVSDQDALGQDGMWEWPSDGIIAMDCAHRVDRYREAAGGDATPIVSLGVTHPTNTDRVHFDLLSGARRAMEHLLAARRKSIVLLCTERASREGDPRFIAYREAMRAARLPARFVTIAGRYPADARSAVQHLVDSGLPVDAIFAEDDLLALGTYKALLESGFKIPDDVALIGCDDTFGMDCLHPALSSIHFPAQEGSAAAWRMLKRRMAKRDGEIEEATFPTQLMLRASSEAGRE